MTRRRSAPDRIIAVRLPDGPPICRYNFDPRIAAFGRKAGLPTSDDVAAAVARGSNPAQAIQDACIHSSNAGA